MILQGDALTCLKTLPTDSVHCCLTSPPYWSLRSYLPNDSPNKSLELGSEDTPEAWVEHLVDVFREVRRVLHPTGVFWLVVGDGYNGAGHGPDAKAGIKGWDGSGRPTHVEGLKHKDLIGLPWMLAFALRADGWYLRSDVIWAKGVSFCDTYSGSVMPESIRDRPTCAHEHVFMLTKSGRYFYDTYAVRDPFVGNTQHDRGDPAYGRNLRNVWTISSRGFSGAHFAVFPEALALPCIKLATSERGCCPKCGSPWVRLVERNLENRVMHDGEWEDAASTMGITGTDGRGGRLRVGLDRKAAAEKSPGYSTLGWREGCECGCDPVPCTVLDPFSGSCTTGVVAHKCGRAFTGIELNPDYIKLGLGRLDGIPRNATKNSDKTTR